MRMGLLVGLLALGALPVHAQFRGMVDVATVSMSAPDTPRLSPNNICATDGTDLVCDRGVEVQSGGLLTATRISATNISATNISATRITGDGSGLTNLPAGATPDRITSGTTSVVANSPTGVISFTQLGTETAYLHPTLGLVAPGVSATGVVSATSAYVGNMLTMRSPSPSTQAFTWTANSGGQLTLDATSNPNIMVLSGNSLFWRTGGGNVGIGIGTTPSATLHVSGTARMTSWTMIGSSADPSSVLHVVGPSNASGGLTIGSADTSATRLRIFPTGAASVIFDISGSSVGWRDNIGSNMMFMSGGSVPAIMVGRGATTPSSTLHVSGTIRMASGGEACDADRTGAIRFTGGDFSVCRNGSAWETLTAIAAGATPDRIISGTTSVVANNGGPISLTVAGATVASVQATGLDVSGTVSTTNVHIAQAGGTCATSADVGRLLRNPTTGRLQICAMR